jgi:phosphonate transport system ATP-binding protein
MSTPIIQLRQVSRQFGPLTALQEISLQVQPGERVALVGPSGAGKSTLLSLINGTMFPSQGEVIVLDRPLATLSAQQLRQLQRSIGTIYQQLNLIESLRVVHNVNAGQLGRWPFWKAALSLLWPQEVMTAGQALAEVGIPEKLYARTDQLSGGQQQRVAIARVLVQDPQLILADEPIASLDPARGQEVMGLLSRLCQEHHKTLIVSLHAVEMALRYCDRIVGLREGRIFFDRPTPEVGEADLKLLYQLTAASNRLALER